MAETKAAAAQTVDVLVLGAGPAGIAAARELLSNHAGQSFLVLEARSRIGGRVHTSDSLGVHRMLDHGARWIHGASADNVMVKLIRDNMPFDVHPDDHGIEYELCLPANPPTTPEEDVAWTPRPSSATTPPFELDDDDTVDHSQLVVKIKNCPEPHPPSKNLTLVVQESHGGVIEAKKPSCQARKVARQIFQEVIQSVMDDPIQKWSNEKAGCGMEDETFFNFSEASLMDLLLWLHDPSPKDLSRLSDQQKRDRFESLCRDSLVMKHELLQEALATIDSPEERQAFQREVMALFNLEIATVLESWEGSSLHGISAKHGMAGTCLEGGNMILPFGYGGLIQRLAYPLLQGNYIRLGHEVVSVQTTTNNKEGTPQVVVRCKVLEDDGMTESIKEYHGKAVIVALPLGVLRHALATTDDSNHPASRRIVLEPPLPPPVVHAIQSLGITVRDKIELAFPHGWWPADVGRFTLACTHLKQSPTYHPYTTFIVESVSEHGPNILVCYVAGEFAKEMAQKTKAQIQEEVMTVLRQANLPPSNNRHDPDIPDPIAIHVTRWLQDPYSRGSWTHYGKGSSPQDVQSFRSNMECQRRHLFFAGEHTCHGSTVQGDDLGCVHGAWVSGELAAKAVLECLS